MFWFRCPDYPWCTAQPLNLLQLIDVHKALVELIHTEIKFYEFLKHKKCSLSTFHSAMLTFNISFCMSGEVFLSCFLFIHFVMRGSSAEKNGLKKTLRFFGYLPLHSLSHEMIIIVVLKVSIWNNKIAVWRSLLTNFFFRDKTESILQECYWNRLFFNWIILFFNISNFPISSANVLNQVSNKFLASSKNRSYYVDLA